MKMPVLIACVVALAAAVPARSSISGLVMNRTTGQPQAAVQVTLIKPGAQGMQTLGATQTDAAGHFQFEHDQPGRGPQLLQALYQGVTYNKLMTPNLPTSGVELDVYDSTKSPAEAPVTQHMMLIEPGPATATITENFIVENRSTRTFDNQALGGVELAIPSGAADDLRANVQGPGGMPLPRPVVKTGKQGVYKVVYPIKPGETQIEVSYRLPVAAQPFTLQGAVAAISGQRQPPLRLVVPDGVTLEGADVRRLGQEPNTRAIVYELANAARFAVKVTGTGSLHTTSGESETADAGETPQVSEGAPALYARLPWLVGAALLTVTAGFLLLWRSSPIEHR